MFTGSREVVPARPLHQSRCPAGGEPPRYRQISGDPGSAHVVRVAGAQPPPAPGVLLVQQVADDLRPERKPEALAHLAANPDVLLLPQVVDLDLVPDPSQERLVRQLRGAMFVEKRMIWSKGISNFFPFCSVR